MTSPAKKRRTNDYKASPKTVRSLDYFFGKQKEKDSIPNGERSRDSADDHYEDKEEQALTDEDLARRLQAQWNEEDRVANDTAARPASPSQPSSNPPIATGNYARSDPKDSHERSVSEENATDEAKEDSRLMGVGENTLSLQSAAAKEDTVTTTIPFDESPLTFDPTKYIPDLKGQWTGEGGNATYALLTRCFVLVNSTQSRIKIVDTLVNFLRTVIEADPESLLPAVRFTIFLWADKC